MLHTLHYQTTIPLGYVSDCSLLGVDTDSMTIYVEELYGGEDWLAQRAVRLDGQIMALMNEQSSQTPLHLPPQALRPTPVRQAVELNFVGPRFRGLRESERIADLVYPLTMSEKIALVQRYNLDVLPPHLLGVAESYVLAEALLAEPDQWIICRRIRLAYALTTPQHDLKGERYDYDSFTIYTAHLYQPHTDDLMLMADPLHLPHMPLLRPMDCMVSSNHLVVAEGGAHERVSALHIWYIPT